MSKRLLWALFLLALSVIVLILSRGSMSIRLGFVTFNAAKSFVLFVFLAVGIVVGLLIK